MENTALLIIDIQNDYFDKGACVLHEPVLASAKAAELLQIFRHRKLPLVHIKHVSISPEAGFMLPGTTGQQIHTSVLPLSGETCITKHYPNAFWQTELQDQLNKQSIKHLVIVGMMTHMCVSMTARAAMERGFKVTVIQDACATRALTLNDKAISAEVVHRTSLAELTLIADIKFLKEFLSTQTTS